MSTYIIVAGNPFDGMTCYGTFPSAEEAIEWAEINFSGLDWWSVELEPIAHHC